jgi:hypothetical protein
VKLALLAAGCGLWATACGGATFPAGEDAGVPIVGDSGATAGQDAEGVAAVTGTAGGLAFEGRSAVGTFSPYQNFTAIVIPANFEQSCADLQQAIRDHSVHSHSRFLLIELFSGTSPASPGEYVVAASTPGDAGPTPSFAMYRVADANCSFTDEYAEGGNVVLTTADSRTIAGRVDLTFSNGDALSGTFSAPVCVETPVPNFSPPVKCLP